MSKKTDSKSHFWPSYVDLMTSLFVIMLVLFILSYIKFAKANADLAANAKQMEKIKEIEKALDQLDTRYFRLDTANNRYRLMVEVNFKPNSADMSKMDSGQLNNLRFAGHLLFQKLDSLKQDKQINYLLIVEGHAAKDYSVHNWINNPHRGDSLSFERAFALRNFWAKSGYKFNELPNCEILTVGSGYFGKSRDNANEANNKRFTIQITPKFNLNRDE